MWPVRIRLPGMAGVRLWTVDAFTDKPFTGNPAAVVLLEEAASDEWMAAVARETNLSDTAFVIRADTPKAAFQLRWFTPTAEVGPLWSRDACFRPLPLAGQALRIRFDLTRTAACSPSAETQMVR